MEVATGYVERWRCVRGRADGVSKEKRGDVGGVCIAAGCEVGRLNEGGGRVDVECALVDSFGGVVVASASVDIAEGEKRFRKVGAVEAHVYVVCVGEAFEAADMGSKL